MPRTSEKVGRRLQGRQSIKTKLLGVAHISADFGILPFVRTQEGDGKVEAQHAPEVPLSFDLIIMNGLARATLVGPDGEIESQTLEGAATTATINLVIMAEADPAGTD